LFSIQGLEAPKPDPKTATVVENKTPQQLTLGLLNEQLQFWRTLFFGDTLAY
jgi:hypothetical protein